MKKISTLFTGLAVIGLALFSNQKAAAQKEAGQSVVTLGVGESLVGSIFSVASSSTSGGSYSISHSPAILGMYDYGLSDRFSIGAAFSYQSFSTAYTNYSYYNSTTGGAYYGSWTDKITRINYAVRALFHFGDNENFDPYFGLRLGFTNWSASTTNPDPNYATDNGFGVTIKGAIAPQVVFGVRYFFTPLIGVNLEAAIGSPYYASAGVNFKFGGSK